MLLDCKDILLENKKQLVKAFKLNVYEEHQNPWKIVFTSRLTVLLFIPLLLEVKKLRYGAGGCVFGFSMDWSDVFARNTQQYNYNFQIL